MLTKSLGSSLVAGAVIAAGTQAYADINVTQSTPKVDLGQKNQSAGFLFPVPATTVENAAGDVAKMTNKQAYYSYAYFPPYSPYIPVGPYYGPYVAPYVTPVVTPYPTILFAPTCGVGVVPFAALTALSIGAMSFHSRRRRATPSQ